MMGPVVLTFLKTFFCVRLYRLWSGLWFRFWFTVLFFGFGL